MNTSTKCLELLDAEVFGTYDESASLISLSKWLASLTGLRNEQLWPFSSLFDSRFMHDSVCGMNPETELGSR